MWQPKHNRQACEAWFRYMLNSQITTREGNDIKLRPPFEILLLRDNGRAITATYKDSEETGGLMFGKFLWSDRKLTLIICEHHQIENVIEKYNPTKSRKGSYLPDPTIYQNILEKNFSKQSSDQILFPIHYHTHPTENQKEDVFYISTGNKLRLSNADKHAANNRSIKLGENILLYLNAIITGNESEHRILFYGNGISPFQFEETKAKQVKQGVKDITEGIENESHKKLAMAGIEIFRRLAVGLSPELSPYLLDKLADFSNRQEYFSIIRENMDTRITIPELKKEEE